MISMCSWHDACELSNTSKYPPSFTQNKFNDFMKKNAFHAMMNIDVHAC